MLKKAILPLLIAGVGLAALHGLGITLDLQCLARRESDLRAFGDDHPVLVWFIAFAAYVAVTGLSLPGATPMSLLYGWHFGWLGGVVLVSFASTAGATVAFLLSRFLFRDAILARFGDRFAAFNQSLKREGPFFLFTLRLIPAVPFVVINAVMGLTPIRVRTFWWVSQLGMLPGTAVYLYAGSSFPSLQTLADQGISAVFTRTQLALITTAFVLLGAFPLAVRVTMAWISALWRVPRPDKKA
ncbi:MAG: TVP38/TMEM64 family protein [Planctomycetes bacterium]|nr:TVP38/TMEM64 family protein [Planctomycetota bacterium]